MEQGTHGKTDDTGIYRGIRWRMWAITSDMPGFPASGYCIHADNPNEKGVLALYAETKEDCWEWLDRLARRHGATRPRLHAN